MDWQKVDTPLSDEDNSTLIEIFAPFSQREVFLIGSAFLTPENYLKLVYGVKNFRPVNIPKWGIGTFSGSSR